MCDTRANLRSRCAAPSTRIPASSGSSWHVPAPGPLTPIRDIATDAPLRISTIEPSPSSPATSVCGASIVVTPAPEPVIVRLLSIDTCSRYTPGSTLIVSPGWEACTADWIDGYAWLGTTRRVGAVPAAAGAE
jgi:hypothetical protein